MEVLQSRTEYLQVVLPGASWALLISTWMSKDGSFPMVVTKDSPSYCKTGRKINYCNTWKHLSSPSEVFKNEKQ